MSKKSIKPVLIGKYDGVEYYRNCDGSISQIVDGMYKDVTVYVKPHYEIIDENGEEKSIEVFLEDMRNLFYESPNGEIKYLSKDDYRLLSVDEYGCFKVVDSRAFGIANALEYVDEIENIKYEKSGKRTTVFLGLVLAGVIALTSALYMKETKSKREYLESDKTYEDSLDYFNREINKNHMIDDELKTELKYYGKRYLQTMEPSINDILDMANKLSTYSGMLSYDHIEELGYILGCEDSSETYDLIEYLQTATPVDSEGYKKILKK